MLMVSLDKFDDRRLLENEESTLRHEDFYDNKKVYVVGYLSNEDIEYQKLIILHKLHDIIEKFEHAIPLHVILPAVDKGERIDEAYDSVWGFRGLLSLLILFSFFQKL